MYRQMVLRSLGMAMVIAVGTAMLAACAPAGLTPTASQPATAQATRLASTPTAAVEAASPTPVLASMELVDEWRVSSPNGEWEAMGETAFPGKAGGERYHTRLTVARVGGGETWPVVEEWRPTGLGWTSPSPLRWSADGTAFYFTNLPHPDGCAVMANGVDLHRVDLATGTVSELLPESAMWVSLSPDERQVAYIGYSDRGLVVRDLATGVEQAFTLDSGLEPAQAGAIVWSPDMARLALTVDHDPCSAEPEMRSILVMDATSGTATTVLDRDAGGWLTTAWPETDRIRLTSPGGDFWLDLKTGEVAPVASL